MENGNFTLSLFALTLCPDLFEHFDGFSSLFPTGARHLQRAPFLQNDFNRLSETGRSLSRNPTAVLSLEWTGHSNRLFPESSA